jgi:hypothetical protein
MKDIEILPDENGVPRVFLHGEAKTAAENRGIRTVHVSLSHSEVRAFSLLSDDFADINVVDGRHRICTSFPVMTQPRRTLKVSDFTSD